ncbi:MAG: glycoside hydrolase family 172 protein [Ruthenibacterium sp.]
MSPSICIPKDSEFVLADIKGSGEIVHLWMTCPTDAWRNLILCIYWDDEPQPSVEVPVGDFFCNGWCKPSLVDSAVVAVAPKTGFNSYWPMPFSTHARVVMKNKHFQDCIIYYQIDYRLQEVSKKTGRFHAQFRRSNPVLHGTHVILDDVHGKGNYVGTYLAWQSNSCDWWGEGEVKVYLDGDGQHPTIAYTGTEDYFGGSYNFELPAGEYCPYTMQYMGLNQVISPDHIYNSQQRFGMYRWHIADAIGFEQDIRVTIDALGVAYDHRYLPLKDDIASTAFWYQEEPHAAFPSLPHWEERYVSSPIDWTVNSNQT